jgi:hypothetical protein
MFEHIPTQKFIKKNNHQAKRDKQNLKRKHNRKYQKINVKKILKKRNVPEILL